MHHTRYDKRANIMIRALFKERNGIHLLSMLKVWRAIEKGLSRSGNHIYLPLFVGLKKKGAITAIPLAPMAAACLAYK